MPSSLYLTKTGMSTLSQGEKYQPATNNVLHSESSAVLAALITRAASNQTYYTIRLLVDRGRQADAFRAYAYFRWLDDWLDQGALEQREKVAFIERQKALMECCYQAAWPADTLPEERMLIDLIQSDLDQYSGLNAYIQNMMAIMAFDAERRGRLISQAELAAYSQHLATAVTEALHYFIGHDDPSPQIEARYLAATAAHITHMLRDSYEDIAMGYFNIPCELLSSEGIGPSEIETGPYLAWVKSRVELARSYVSEGKRYLAQVKNVRCRIAGYAYIARFEGIVDAIAREGYRLRPEYHDSKGLRAVQKMGWSVLSLTLKSRFLEPSEPICKDV